MASWVLIELLTGKHVEGSWRYDAGSPQEDAKPGLTWSFHEYYYYVDTPIGSMTRCKLGTAEGSLSWSRNGQGDHVEIEIVGTKVADIKKVLERLEEEMGVKHLNPRLQLPENLVSMKERILFLTNWITQSSK